MERERWIGLSLSGVLHAALLLGAGLFVVQKAEYGVAPGQSSAAVELVEGAAPAVKPNPEPPLPATPSQADPDGMTQALLRRPEPRTPSVPRVSQRPAPRVYPATAPSKGATGTGRDSATLRRASGTSAQPDYLRNPPPVYPEESRRKGEQGTVLVKVLVTPRGTSQDVVLDRSSGFPSLDRAALEAVRRWRFRAATTAGAPVASYAFVPIIFRLASH